MRQYEIYLVKAIEDFNAGKYLLDGYNFHGLEIKLEIVFFHFQQSVEKLLKAVLDFHSIKFPKTHDIEDLVALCRMDSIILVENVDMLVDLTDYAVEGRYAVIHDDLQNIDKYIAILEELCIAVKKNILKDDNEQYIQ